MRTSLLPCLLFCLPAMAQIPNGGFEAWTNVGNYSDPDGWTTENAIFYSAGQVLSCTQGAPGYEGALHVKVTTRDLPGLGIVQGSIFTGTPEQPGFAYAQRPPTLDGQWQFYMANGDVCGITVFLTRWNTDLGQRDPVGTGTWFGSGILPVWQPFSIPINYVSALDPDTAFIQITSSTGTPGDGSTIWVDALAFGTITDMAEQAPTVDVLLRPTLAEDLIMLSASSDMATVILLDMSARVLDREVVNGTSATVEVAQLPAGTYLAHVILANGRSAVRVFVKG